ncbi:MAG: transposase [Lachnospiraceae bacterium]|nr:transposase [Lachnospiraceae bacterium]MDD6504497.1 transposase [Lachnospiraceae bacterium]
MSRHARKKSSIQTYHVVIKGADRQLLFEESKDYLKYLDILKYYKEKFDFEIYAYCLMSNHVHLLIHHPVGTSLETIFRHINTTYAGWFNLKYDRTGFVQDGRYFSEPVETAGYLLTVVRYIHYNPTKAGLEIRPGAAYLWSSYNDYINGFSDLTDTGYILKLLGTQEQYIALHNIVPDDDCFDIHQARKRLPDDVAKDMIEGLCSCKSVTDFQRLSLIDRDKNILLLHEKGISIRQLNRLTGTPRGVINRIITQENPE